MRLTLATPYFATSASRPSMIDGWVLSASMSTARRAWPSSASEREIGARAIGSLRRMHGRRRRRRRRVDVQRLDVHELADAVLGELAAEARGLGAAERQAHVAAHLGVDEGGAHLQLPRHALAGGGVAGPHAGAEA